MLSLRKGRYTARLAASEADVTRAQRLRHLAFIENRDGATPRPDGLDRDRFDSQCRHVMVERIGDGELVCSFRLLPLADGTEIAKSYSAQYYELSGLRDFAGPMIEMGRFCIHPDCRDPDILRTAWAALARYVDQEGVEMLFGCSSFNGAEASVHDEAFALLKENHLAPKRWLPRVKAPKVFRFAQRLRLRVPDLKRGVAAIPPLLRSYLMLGGWVSDHAVVDTDLNTMHVFTGLEIGKIPPARARLLRASAA